VAKFSGGAVGGNSQRVGRWLQFNRGRTAEETDELQKIFTGRVKGLVIHPRGRANQTNCL
jgi:hypothetical protein